MKSEIRTFWANNQNQDWIKKEINMLRLDKKFILIAVLFCGVNGLAGCSGAPTTSNSGNSVVVANGGNTSAATTPANTAKTETTAAREKIGVAECDEFIEKYEVCLTKIPENERDAKKGALDLSRMIWKEDAATPKGRATLAKRCKVVMDITKQTTLQYGCEW
jgi:hypothetical protein